ncbi:ATP-binding protein [bacterium]|nr:MAG: ATP-binding protein [bacterium]
MPSPAYIDSGLMFHVFNNLTDNAFKFSRGKQNPELTLTFGKDNITIALKDYGIGIPDDEIKNLFKSFYRTKNALGISGSGIGLVIIKQFLDIHGGTIMVESVENNGTTFTVNLPYKKEIKA